MSIIIAECGSNFEGSLSRAKEMIHAAAENGAQMVKFQMFPQVMFPHNIALPQEWLPELEYEAKIKGIGFFCSWFYEPAQPVFMAKIAYSQRHNFRLLRHFQDTKTQLIVSGDKNTYWPKDCIKLLCVPHYPAEKKDYLPIGAGYDGISDHTIGIDFLLEQHPRWIEKHFKLGDEKKSPDRGAFAMTPKELKELVECLN